VATTGDIVIVDFPGVQGFKRRPAVIVSSDLYHQTRPDITVGLITSQVGSATGPTDHVLYDWKAAGLNKHSAFRSFFASLAQKSIISRIGRLSDRDLQAVVACVRAAMAS
jgi:mRNA interferase MazF